MNSVKILHTADLHLGSARTGVKGGKAEIENTFFKIINLCKTENVDFLLIAGDLFDTPFVSPEDSSKILSMMAQIPETTIVISPGNHDCACPGSIYLKCRFPENVVVFTSFCEYKDFPEKGVRIWGAGFTDRFEKIPLLQNTESGSSDFINIGVLHGDIVSQSSTSVYNPITLTAIEDSGFDYLALGHIHKRSEIQHAGNTSFSYSGCPDGMGFDEPGSHGVYLGTVSKNSCDLKYIELSSRQYIIESVDVSKCKNSFDVSNAVLAYIKNTYGEDYTRNLYRLHLTGNVSVDTVIQPAQIRAALTESFDYIEVFDKTDTDISDLSTFLNETSLRGIFVKKMLERIKNSSPKEQLEYKNALKIGLRAFGKGVSLNDN